MSVLDFFGDFVFLEHRRNEQTGIKTIFDHFRNTHACYRSGTFLAERISESKQLTLTGRNAKSSLQTEAHFRTYLIETLLDAGVSSACARVKCMKTANSRVHS